MGKFYIWCIDRESPRACNPQSTGTFIDPVTGISIDTSNTTISPPDEWADCGVGCVNGDCRWYLNTLVFGFALILISLNFIFIFKSIPKTEIPNVRGRVSRLDFVRNNMSIDDVIQLNDFYNLHNLDILSDCVKRNPITHPKWCEYEGDGPAIKAVLLGNSFTWNHHKMLIQECRHQVKNFTMDSEEGCEPLAATNLFPECEKRLEDFSALLKAIRPHYAFILSRFYAVGEPFTNNSLDLENDRIYLQMRAQLRKFLPNIRQKLYILDSIPRVNGENVKNIARDLKRGVSPDEISKTLHSPDGYERGRLRHAALLNECFGKCELIDYLPLLTRNFTTLPTFFDDSGISYFTSVGHLSAHGIELVRPIYRQICDSLMDR